MCWAVLDLFLAGARGLGLSDLEYKQVGPMKIAGLIASKPSARSRNMPLTAGATPPLYSNPGPRSWGSGDSLKVSVRCGCRPKARQMRLMVGRLRPVAAAMERAVAGVARLTRS